MKQQSYAKKAVLSHPTENLRLQNIQNNIISKTDRIPRLPVSSSPSQSSTVNSERRDITYRRQYWGDIPDTSEFVGRDRELDILQQWIVKDRSRLTILLGMGGIGKTALAAKLTRQVQSEFESVIWRSLRNAPPIEETLTDLIQFLSSGDRDDLPSSFEGKILLLLECLKSSRCLLVWDDFDSILQSGEQRGTYRPQYEGYGQLIRYLTTTDHQSCLLITSQEKPKGLKLQEGQKLPVCSLTLGGLSLRQIKQILGKMDTFSGTDSEWQFLINYYGGNPLFNKLVAAYIRDLFECSISQFLALRKNGMFILPSLRQQLDRQFDRLSDWEKEIMYRLAMECVPLKMDELRSRMWFCGSEDKWLDALGSLLQRSLIEKTNAGFRQSPLIEDYVNAKSLEIIAALSA